MSKVRIILVLLLAATASHAAVNAGTGGVFDAAGAVALFTERPSLTLMADAAIMVAALLAIVFWDFLTPSARSKSELRPGERGDARRAPERK